MNIKSVRWVFLIVTFCNFLFFVGCIAFFLYFGKGLEKNHKNLSSDITVSGLLNNSFKNSSSSLNETDNDIVSDYVDIVEKDDWTGTYNDAAVKLYLNKIENKSFYVSDTIIFSFGLNGNFSGFFDSNNQNVTGYFYEVKYEEDAVFLYIYTSDHTVAVVYQMVLNDINNIELHYTKADVVLELK